MQEESMKLGTGVARFPHNLRGKMTVDLQSLEIDSYREGSIALKFETLLHSFRATTLTLSGLTRHLKNKPLPECD